MPVTVTALTAGTIIACLCCNKYNVTGCTVSARITSTFASVNTASLSDVN